MKPEYFPGHFLEDSFWKCQVPPHLTLRGKKLTAGNMGKKSTWNENLKRKFIFLKPPSWIPSSF